MPALRNVRKPPARVIRRGSRILKPAASTAGGGGTVTFDAAGATVPNSATSPVTWTHVNSGNCIIICFINAAAASDPVTAVTYGGVTIPLVKYQQTGQPLGGCGMYGLAGPTVPTGSNTVSVTYTTGAGDNIASSVSAAGVGSFGTPVSGASNASSLTVSVASTTAGGLVVVGAAYGGASGGGTFSGTNGVTIRWSKLVSNSFAADNGACGTVASTGGGASQTAGISASAGADWFAMAAVELLPAAGGAQAGTAAAAGAGSVTAKAVQIAGASAAGAGAATASTKPYIAGLAGSGAAGYFADQYGQPRLGLADNPWGLIPNAGRWSGTYQTTLDAYFDARGAQGFTAIYLDPYGNTENGGVANDGRTYDGVLPFVSGDPGTLNSTFFTRVDYALAAAARNGITIFLNICYTQDIDTAGGCLQSKTNTQYTNYGTALGNRYKTTPNIVWVTGNDYFDSYQTPHTNIKNGIRGTGDTHVFSVHNMPESTSRFTLDTSAAQATGTALAEFNFAYSYDCWYLSIEYAYQEASPLPVALGDGYFYANSTNSYDATLDRAARQETWWAYASGARFVNFGSEGIWQWDTSAAAQTTGEYFYTTTAGNIRAAVEALAGWHQLIPDTANQLVTGGRGTRNTQFASGGGGGQYEPSTANAYVAASRTPDSGSGSSLALIYVPHATTITIDQAKMGTGYTAKRIDPDTGAATAVTAGSTYNTTSYGNNARGDPDWVLVLQAPAAAALPDLAMATRIAP